MKWVEAKRRFPKPLRLGKDTSAKDRDLKALKCRDSKAGVFRRGRVSSFKLSEALAFQLLEP